MFWILLSLVLLIATMLLARRLLVIKSSLVDLAAAMSCRGPYIFPRDRSLAKLYQLDVIEEAYNQLIADKAQATRQEQGYLRQIEAIMSNMKEAVLLVNGDNRLVMANAAAKALFSNRDAPEGVRLEAVLRSVGFLSYVHRVARGEPTTREEISITPGKETLWFEVSGRAMEGVGQRQEQWMLFVLHNITRLKRLENVRKDFVANVSHELRTPVTIIKGFADTLGDDYTRLGDSDRLRFLEKIRKNANRLHALLEDLLTLSRLESQGVLLRMELQSLHRVIRDAVDELPLGSDASRIAVDLQLAPETDRILFDPIKIGQVLRNLLDNAIRYAKGHTYIRIITQREGAYIRVTVEDNGCGIPAVDVPHLFERFYRVDKGRGRESGGTGLGLSIVKHIVQIHGGEVSAESEEGRGSRFHFTLPADTQPGTTPVDKPQAIIVGR
jgi:two-component system phosphate regulon sensor histidine kinase PhoR